MKKIFLILVIVLLGAALFSMSNNAGGNSADAHRGLARALVKQGKADEAEEHRLLAEEIERYAK